MIQNLNFDEDTKKNEVDFNTKYLTKEADLVREKLKSRQSRKENNRNLQPEQEKKYQNEGKLKIVYCLFN